MTPTRGALHEDAAALYEPPRLAQSAGALDHPLEKPVVGRFRLRGRRAMAACEPDGLVEVRVGPVAVRDGPRIHGAVPSRALLTPLGADRSLEVDGSAVSERIVVPRDAPACIVEWVSPEGSLEIDVACAVSGPGLSDAARPVPRGVILHGSPGVLAMVFSAEPCSLEVTVGPGSSPVRVAARLRLRKGEPVRMALAGGADEGEMRRGLAAAARIGELTRARRASAMRRRTEGLRLEAPDPEAVRAVGWARHDLDAAGPGLEDGEDRAAWRGLEALAAGEHRLAHDALRLLGEAREPPGGASGDPWLYLLLAGSYLAWTDDIPTLRREWPRLQQAWRSIAPGRARGALASAAVARLADAAESIGETGAAAAFRTAAAGERQAPWWEEYPGSSAILQLVHGRLGAEPDGTRGRLVLRPDPPSGWDRFRVGGLTMGDASIALDYRRVADRHTFRLEQERGTPPATLVFEPVLPGRTIRRAEVDGVTADLDARRRGGRLLIPLQVVLDHTRRVTLVTG